MFFFKGMAYQCTDSRVPFIQIKSNETELDERKRRLRLEKASLMYLKGFLISLYMIIMVCNAKKVEMDVEK